MIKNKLTKKIIAVFLTINFLQTIMPYGLLYANNNGPKSPEAASFEPVDATDMVSLVTGDLSYVLPLLDVPSPEGGYPLALSYHAGIAMEQEASWVGLGWNVNPGAINRTVSGYPDDWKTGKKAQIVFDKGGVYKGYNLGVSLSFDEGLNSVGVQASYSTNKTFGGETTHNFDVDLTYTYAGIISGSLGTTGIGLSLSATRGIGEDRKAGAKGKNDLGSNSQAVGFSIGANYSFKGEGFSANADASMGSAGFNLSTKGGASLNAGGNSISLSGSSAVSTPLSFNNTNIGITFPLFKVVRINLSFNKSRYWLFDKSEFQCLGSLYAGDLTSQLNAHPLPFKVVSDAYESIYKFNQRKQFSDNNFSFVSYDNYAVSGQGIGGSLTPNLYEHGSLKLKNQLAANGSTKSEYDDSFTKQVDNSQNDIHFNMDGTNSSYLRVRSDNWIAPPTSINSITDFQLANKETVSEVLIDGVYESNYNGQNKRKTVGPFVEVFTNQEIINNPNLISEAKNLNRSSTLNSNMMLGYGEGIGAYKITALDGKTYHYSLPVYQKEEFTRSSEKEDDSELKFYEEQNFTPYATHWLLTAITGPDYIDKNSNGYIDEDDYGYWVDFEYGKWSDGYTWRNPSIGDFEGENSKSYSWGIKEVYYLDAIKTRTHTALFVKEDRKDNMSSQIYVNDPNNSNAPKVYNDNTINKYTIGKDGKFYFSGIYTNRSIPLGNVPYLWNGYIKYKFLVNINRHKSLKLKKILLLKNSDIPQALNTTNNLEASSSFEGRIKFEENFRIFNSVGQLYDDYDETPLDKTWYGEFYQNVLDVNDINILTPNILDKTLKVIDFNYDENYPLAKNTPSSDASSKGRLTLKNVAFKGKKGIQLVPSYAFNYYHSNISYSKTNADDWGYYGDPSIWSLREIKDPLGGKIKITYESDDYHEVAAGGKRSFSTNLQLRFTGTNSGEKWVDIRWDPDYADRGDPENDLRNYFEVGNYSEGARIEYARHTSTNSGNRYMARILNQDLLITDVSRYEVKLKLPTNETPNVTFEEASLCDDDDFVYYVRYDGSQSVVSKTSGWHDLNTKCDIDNRDETSVKAFVQGSKNQFIDAKGGGLRVKSLETVDGNGKSYKKAYYYNDLNYDKNPYSNNYQSSGITSYTPTNYFQEIPYRSELPSPGVMYNTVTVENLDSNDNLELKTVYRFKTLEPLVIGQYNNNFSFGDALNLSIIQRITNNTIVDGENSSIERLKYKLDSNLSSIGRLMSTEVLNKEDQLVSKTVNNYKPIEQMKQGISEESFNSFKNNKPSINSSALQKYKVNVSSKTTYPNVLESTTVVKGGFSNTTYYDKYDFNSGKLLETRSYTSDGSAIKTQIIPAYTKYPLMGSKNDTPSSTIYSNKNMLSQEAGAFTYLLDETSNNWKEINAAVTTWNLYDYVTSSTSPVVHHGIWRKYQNYVWEGAINNDGTYQNFSEFNWNDSSNLASEWKKISEITKFNEYSTQLEIVDINNNYAATKMCDNDTKIMAVSNARYNEIFYSGAEYIDANTNLFDGNVSSNGRSFEKAHTGKYSVKTDNNLPVFQVNLNSGEHDSGKYKISVWADVIGHDNGRIHINGVTKPFNGEKVFAGGWVQLNHYEDLSSNSEVVYVTSASSVVYFDDFRLHPIASTMTSYVYNEWDELWCIIGSNNLSTKFEYDSSGSLIKTFTEIEKNGIDLGGFKLVSKNKINYKKAQ